MLIGLCCDLARGTDPQWKAAVGQARALQREGNYAAAETVLLAALSEAKRTPTQDGRLPTILNNLASVCQDRGQIEEAERYYRRAIALIERDFGSLEPALSKPLRNLASLYDEQGEFAKAERLVRQALALSKLPETETSPLLFGLATALEGQKKLDEADSLYRQALAAWENTEGHERDLADVLNNLGFLCSKRNRAEEGAVFLTRSIRILEKTAGPEHAALVRPLHNLAAIYLQTHRPADAEPLLARALTIAADAYGPDNPVYGGVLRTDAIALRQLNRKQESKEAERRAHAILSSWKGLRSSWETVDINDLKQARPER